MRIGIDYISSYGTGGNGTYSRELSRALAAKTDLELMLYTYAHHCIPRARTAALSATAHFAGAYLPSFRWPSVTRIAENISHSLLQWRMRHDRIGVMHFTNPLLYVEGIGKQTRVVVTLHDLAPLRHPEWVKPSTAIMYRDLMESIVTRANAIIAVSEATRNDLCESFPSAEEKTSVIYEGVSEEYFVHKTDSRLLAHYNIRAPYVLSVGEVQPRKNLATLIQAFTLLPEAIRSATELVLVGAPRNAGELARLQDMVHNAGIADHVRILGYVPREDLLQLYRQADMFVYLSFLEGFGLPVLEAMAAGVPVLAANTSSLPEVGGDAVQYADPLDAAQVSKHIAALLADARQRDSMRERGIERAKTFTWEKAARETMEVYHRVLES